ncbi:efflux transporter outer membrane subunit, partial [bacterium]|nr:efflux transporter outer membrane subunit [bacterium]
INKVKKIVSTALLMSILSMNFIPALADDNKTITTPKQFKSMVKKNKKVSDAYKFAYVNMDWWSNFDDSILNDYINKAILHNYDLKMATLAVDEYYQQVKLQLGNELPQLTAAGGYGLTKMPGSTSTSQALGLPILVNYEADIFLKNHDKTKSVRKSYEGSKLDERAAYIAIASAVGTVYFNIIKLDKVIALQEEIVNIRQEIYDLFLARNREGLTSTADTIKANKSLVAGKSNLLELQKQRKQLLHRLCVLIGESPENADSIKRASIDDVKYELEIPNEISSEIIIQRPDYMKAELMVEKAGIDVRVAKKEFLPTLSLGGLGLFNAANIGSLFTTENMLLGLGGGLILPLFTGGKKIANLRLKKATYERILQNYYKTNLTAIQEVNDSLAAAKYDKEKMLQTIKQYKLEENDYAYNEKKYNQGVISKLDLIQFKENLLSIEKLVAQQKVECMADSIGLYKATGSKPYADIK